MTAAIVNAAPMTIMLGTQDKSTRPLVPEAEALPTHLPKIYIFAKKGPTTPQLVVGGSRSKMYGEESFDLRKPWATHGTALANTINRAGNSAMYERLRPADAGPNASLRLSLDLLETQVDDYERNSDGSIKLNAGGAPIVTGQVAGYRAKWVVEAIPTDVDGALEFGLGTQGPGDQVDGVTQSVRYPIMDLVTPDFGADGNNRGVRIWAPTTLSSQPVDERIIQNEKVYPFRIACAARADELATAKTVETQSAEQSVQVCWKPETINRLTDSELSIDNVFIQAYQTLNDPTFPDSYGPFGQLRVYHDQIQAVLDLVYAAEVPHIDAFSDIDGVSDGDEHRLNLIGGVSSQGVPYHSYQIVTGAANSARLSEISTLFAAGGSDGTMGEEAYGALVAERVVEYANENSVLQDTAKYPESIIYDSGFPLDTKYALLSALAIRKDIAVVLSTHDVLGPQLSASEESALAIALKTRAQMYPESEYFGTPVMRCMIVGRSGKMIGSQYRKPLPLTFEIAAKAASYMGAGNGKWKGGFAFDSAPLSEVTMFSDINVTFTPAKVRNKDWANGLVWVESFGRRSVYFPALKTVYDNDTSVLNSFFTMMACVELQKVGDRARRQYSGNAALTNAQLVERVNQFVSDDVEGRFDGRFVIQPDAYFTEADVARGYSWTLPIRLYAANMKTVMTLSIEAYRIEDLAA